jgi:hypothetical protein
MEPGGAVLVGAAEAPGQLAWYSARGTAGEAPIAFTQLVDPLSDEAGSHGTGEAAERAAGKLAALGRRAAQAFARAGRPLPDGLMLLVKELVERSLTPIPGRGPQEVGGGLFGDDLGPLNDALDRRLADLDAASKDAGELAEAARRRHADNLIAAGPLDVLARSAAAALQQVLAAAGPAEDAAQRWVEALLFDRRAPWVQPVSVRYARGPRKTVDLAPAW